MMTYIIMSFFVLALISHGSYTFWKIKKHLHILQLNSYFNSRYFIWLKKRALQVFHYKDLEPLIALLGVFFQVPLVMLTLFVLIYFRLLLLRTKLPEKKPLVFTARAKRLFGVNLVFVAMLYLMSFVLLWRHGDIWFALTLVLLVVYNFFMPIFFMLINWLVMPLEQLIQNWYFRDACQRRRALLNLKVIGITGSFGKTTTKYVLAEILRQKFNTLMTPGSYNTTMGVTKVIRSDLKPTHDVFVVEMSAKKPGDIKELCELVKPQYGLITAIGEQHLETFKTLENIIDTKNELIESLSPDGIACFNADDINCQKLAKAAKCHVVRYGIEAVDSGLDYLVKDLTINEHGSNFTVVRTRDNSQAVFQTKLLGKYNIYNVLGAIALASEFGMQLNEMLYPIRQLAAIPHRLALKRVGADIIFIDDAFNSNPVGSKMALEVLEQISGKRKIIITPGMIELGAKEDEYNERFGKYIAEVCDYVILVGRKQTEALQRGLLAKKHPDGALFIATDFAAAKQHLEQILQAGDVVLFENDLPDNYSE
ncbi:UDP-N-acetylmuramoyl-tripeptide--D-alanyl-D-alanine ligase [Gammaproteobacteria bacterium]